MQLMSESVSCRLPVRDAVGIMPGGAVDDEVLAVTAHHRRIAVVPIVKVGGATRDDRYPTGGIQRLVPDRLAVHFAAIHFPRTHELGRPRRENGITARVALVTGGGGPAEEPTLVRISRVLRLVDHVQVVHVEEATQQVSPDLFPVGRFVHIAPIVHVACLADTRRGEKQRGNARDRLPTSNQYELVVSCVGLPLAARAFQPLRHRPHFARIYPGRQPQTIVSRRPEMTSGSISRLPLPRRGCDVRQ